MKRHSIKARLIATVVLSQALLVAGVLSAGLFYAHRRLLSTLDAGMQSRAMSIAALVRYTEDASGNVYFDDSLLPASLDPSHPDLFAVWTERSGLLTRSANWPQGLEISPDGENHWNLDWSHVPYRGLRVAHVPVLDREEGSSFHPQTLTIVYAAPMLRMRAASAGCGRFCRSCELIVAGCNCVAGAMGHSPRTGAVAGANCAGIADLGAELGVALARRMRNRCKNFVRSRRR